MADYNRTIFPFYFPALFVVIFYLTQMTFFPFTFPAWFVHEPD